MKTDTRFQTEPEPPLFRLLDMLSVQADHLYDLAVRAVDLDEPPQAADRRLKTPRRERGSLVRS
jgi:hypothetical protein